MNSHSSSKRSEPSSTTPPSPRRRLPWFAVFFVTFVIAVSVFYWQRTRLPSRIVIAGGREGGRYAELAEAIAAELTRRLHVEVVVMSTDGSIANLRLLESHQADLGLYQSGTIQILGDDISDDQTARAAFVSNLYSEYLLPVGRTATAGSAMNNSEPHAWFSNSRLSGDYAAARLLQQHLGIPNEKISSVKYQELATGISTGEIDVGVVCCGLAAPVLSDLVKSPDVALLPIPAPHAFAHKFSMLSPDVVPQGYFSTAPMIPAEDFSTVSFRAQLLADVDAPVRLVEEVAAIILDAGFQRREGLIHLLDEGTDYAAMRPEFDLHAGAEHVFSPELKPLLNPDFVEGTEGLRSFFVSLIAAAWLLTRWWKQRQLRSQEHRLDRYIRDLLQLERDQMEVDGEAGVEDGVFLQGLLDKVTILRQEALSEFTAHELNEDSAVDCFIQMCHALSDKINAKLTRNIILQTTRVSSAANTETD